MLTKYTIKPDSVKEWLYRIYNLIEQGWTTSALARDENDLVIDVYSDRADSACLTGAIFRAYSVYLDDEDLYRMVIDSLISACMSIYNCESLMYFNDSLAENKLDVLRLIEAASVE